MATRTDKPKFDAYQAVTDQIIELLEQGTAPWRQPWAAGAGFPKSLTTGKPYRGVNVFILHTTALARGYQRPEWGTYKAITEAGGQVRKGERSTFIVFFSPIVSKDKVDPRTGRPERYFVLRGYRVFNVEQADGLTLPALAERTEHEPIEEAERLAAEFFVREGAPRVVTGAHAAFYLPRTDEIHVPALDAHVKAAEYYSTLFHEIGHATGHESRLARKGVTEHTHFGDDLYAREELVAELTSALLCGVAGIAPETIDNSAAYLANWIARLREDSRLIVQAAAQAQKAADLVQGITWADQDATTQPTEQKAA